MVVLDTSFLIDVQHGVPAAVARMKELSAGRQPLRLPAVVALEYAGGRRDPVSAWKTFRESFIIVDFNAAMAERASLLAAGAFRKGRFPGWSDVQVAATAAELGETIITRDGAAMRAFEDIRTETYR